MKHLHLVVALGLLVVLNPMNAQVNISKYEAEKIDNSAKLFIVPMVANIELVKGAQTNYNMTADIVLPKSSDGKTLASESVVRNAINSQMEELKARALYEFSELTNASVILKPIFKITTTSSVANKVTINVAVKGIPAKYVNYRTLTTADAELVRISQQITNNKSVEVISTTEKTVNNRYNEVYQ